MQGVFSVYLILCLLQGVAGWGATWSLLIDSKTNGLFYSLPNYLYKDSFVSVQVICDAKDENLIIYPVWILQSVECMQDMYNNNETTQTTIMQMIPDREDLANSPEYNRKNYSQVFKNHRDVRYKEVTFQISKEQDLKCGHNQIISLEDEAKEPYYQAQIPVGMQGANAAYRFWKRTRDGHGKNQTRHRVTNTWADGMYHFLLSITATTKNSSYTAKVFVQMRSEDGYLSAINWPLLPYSGVMSLMYLMLGTVWLAMWIKTTLHTEKIHIFIGAVAVAGAMTNTLMFVDMLTTNSNGNPVPGLSWVSRMSASIQSCLTSALLMVVSTGYGITRPTLHKHLIGGMAVLTGVAIVTRVAVVFVQDEKLKIKYDYPVVDMIVSGLYAFTMLFIAAFIMIASIMTFQHLWNRRHSQQVVLFCLFMVTCIIGFIAEGVMMGIAYGWFAACRTNWKMEWIFANFGSVETLVLLTVLMWLWRPIDRAQSYAFYPLKTEEQDGVSESDEDEIYVAQDKQKGALEMKNVLNGTL